MPHSLAKVRCGVSSQKYVISVSDKNLSHNNINSAASKQTALVCICLALALNSLSQWFNFSCSLFLFFVIFYKWSNIAPMRSEQPLFTTFEPRVKISKQTHNVVTTWLQRRCNVTTLLWRCNDIDATLCLSWVVPLKSNYTPTCRSKVVVLMTCSLCDVVITKTRLFNYIENFTIKQ